MWKRSERTKKVDCQQVEAWLIAYLKDGLSPRRRQMVEDHLAACAACARSVQQTQILDSELRLQAARHRPTLSAEASARIHERVYRRMRRGLIMQRAARLVGVAVAVVLIALVAVGAIALWQGRPPETVDEQEVVPEFTQSVPTSVPATRTSVPPTSAPEPMATDTATPPQAQFLSQTYTIGEDMWFGLAVADLNGDAHPDIAVTDLGSDELRLLFNQGDGTFREAMKIATGEDPRGVAAADLDGDSDIDLIVAHSPDDRAGKLSVLMSNGDGTLQEQVDYATVDNWWVLTVDVDGDTDLDLVIEDATDKASSGGVFGPRVLLNAGDGTFQDGERYFYLPYIGNIVAGDIDGDAIPDLVIRCLPEPKISVQFGNGDGSFTEPVDYETAPSMHAIALVDLNGDGHLDVATGNKFGVISVLINQGDGTFRDKADFDVGGEVWNIDAMDMDGDASLDLLVGYTQSGNLGLLTNNGTGAFELSKEYYWKGAWATNWRVVDVDGDGNPDFVGVDSDSVYVLPLENGD